MTSNTFDLIRQPRELCDLEWDEARTYVTADDKRMALVALAEAKGVAVHELSERFQRGHITADDLELFSKLAFRRSQLEYLNGQALSEVLLGRWANTPTYDDLVLLARDELQVLAERHAPDWVPRNAAEMDWMINRLLSVRVIRELQRTAEPPAGDAVAWAPDEVYLAAEEQRVYAWLHRADDQLIVAQAAAYRHAAKEAAVATASTAADEAEQEEEEEAGMEQRLRDLLARFASKD